MTSSLSPRARSAYVATVLSGNSHARHAAGAPHRFTGLLHGPSVRAAFGSVKSATARLGWWSTSVGKLAVIRRADGAFVINVDAGSRDHAEGLLGLVREQLATMTVDQFEYAWGIDPASTIPRARALPSAG